MLETRELVTPGQAAPAASANGTPAPSPDKGPAQATAAPQAEAPKADGTRDWKAEYEKVEKDRIAPLMSAKDTAENALKAANEKNAELEGAVEGAVETVHEEWETWIRTLASQGLSAKQMVIALERSKQQAEGAARVDRAASGEAVSLINVELRAGHTAFADYLDSIKDAGGKVTAKTLPTLRTAFEKLGGAPASTTAVATAAAATGAAAIPPTSTAAAGGVIPPAPVYRPGMKPRDLFGLAFKRGEPRPASARPARP